MISQESGREKKEQDQEQEIEDLKTEVSGIKMWTEGDWNVRVAKRATNYFGAYETKVEGNSFTLVLGAEHKIVIGAETKQVYGAEAKLILPVAVDIFAGIKFEAVLAAIFEMSCTAKFEKHVGPTYEWKGLRHLELVPTTDQVVLAAKNELYTEVNRRAVNVNQQIATLRTDVANLQAAALQAYHQYWNLDVTVGQLQAQMGSVQATLGATRIQAAQLSLNSLANMDLVAVGGLSLLSGPSSLQVSPVAVTVNSPLWNVSNAIVVMP